MRHEFDYILVGGGLQNALVALALRARRPAATWALVESAPRLGGNHTWCFHAADLDAGARAWVAPLVAGRWPGYDVRFPGFARRLDSEYSMLTSARLHDVLVEVSRERPDCRLLTNTAATQVDAAHVTLAGGERLGAKVVIDARGIATSPAPRAGEGYQKFLGLEIELVQPHALDRPILMDATVDQHDGFRFVYTLPIGPRRLLVEDTYFANDPTLARDLLRRRIHDYVAGMGLVVARIEREEEGILPMPWRERAPWPRRGPLLAGTRGGFFHPGTGYSLPIAVRLAELVASLAPEDLVGPHLQDFVRSHRRQARFCRLLNHMLFRWFPPAERWHIMHRFYGLPLETIERFYALRLRRIDRARLVLGRPPRGMSLRYRLGQGAER
jgi:lycopene beta-cyclase